MSDRTTELRQRAQLSALQEQQQTGIQVLLDKAWILRIKYASPTDLIKKTVALAMTLY